MKAKPVEARISTITLGVSDLPRSIRFYRDGLRFPTNAKDDDEIAVFITAGTRLALYSLKKLAEDVGPHVKSGKGFSGVTLGHNVRKKEDVAQVLAFVEQAGGKIEKPAQDVFWGGHSGYFSDPDGYCWEVVWAPQVTFDKHGHILL
jgi:uncharacterized protein